jgi:hypothetical protein
LPRSGCEPAGVLHTQSELGRVHVKQRRR